MKSVSGIYKNGAKWIVDKYVYGIRIRASFVDRSEAKEYVLTKVHEIRQAKLLGIRPDFTLNQAVLRFIEEKLEQKKPSAQTDVYIYKRMTHFINIDTPISGVNNSTLQPWRSSTRKDGKPNSPKTIRLGIGLIRSVLNRASTDWLVPGTELCMLERSPTFRLPPLVDQRGPRSLTLAEQDRLLKELPSHLRPMVQFALHTGARERVIVNLRWSWRRDVTPHGDFVFYIPQRYVKGRQKDAVLVLNSIAKQIVEAQIGKHPDYVFCFTRGRGAAESTTPLGSINNTAWQKARDRAGLRGLRVHDLRHCFASRLRSTGVTEATIRDLLWHSAASVTQHYMRSSFKELRDAVERLCKGLPEEDLKMDDLRQQARAAWITRSDGGSGNAEEEQ